LDPEFVVPQDGHDKQDCEQQAIKRWVRRNAQRFEPWSVTILADDLHSHQPLCELLLENKLHFILTCKRDSHPALYQELELLTKVEGAHQTHTVRRWKKDHYEQWHYRWVAQVPIRAGAKALLVNWCEVTVVREDNGKQVYYNAWITSHELTTKTVEEVADAGRARWKVENEGFNVLKRQGYEFEHNFGHGQQHLSMVLLTLLFLAFLFHSVLHLTWAVYQAIRKALGAKRRDILAQFLVESATLSTVGALGGIALGIGFSQVIAAVTPLPASVAPWSIIVGVAVGMGVGIISGVYPASRASRLDPVVALRQE
jgi:hypothetical protein